MKADNLAKTINTMIVMGKDWTDIVATVQSTLEEEFRSGYIAGFMSTGEGFNAEYPFDYDDKEILKDEEFNDNLTDAINNSHNAN
jgi:hypothetical protein